jgi:hypothetical protein
MDIPVRLAFLDSTAAYDSVPHTNLDVMFARLHCPFDTITWIRVVVSGHRRVVITARGIDADADSTLLEGGTPQGLTASPALWDVVEDYPLTMACEDGGRGVSLGPGGFVSRRPGFMDDPHPADIAAPPADVDCDAQGDDDATAAVNGFADDLSAESEQEEVCFLRDDGDETTVDQLELTVLVLSVGSAFNGGKFSGAKSFNTWSPAAARMVGRTPTERPKTPFAVHMLDADGVWRRTALTSVPPRGNPEGKTPADRVASCDSWGCISAFWGAHRVMCVIVTATGGANSGVLIEPKQHGSSTSVVRCDRMCNSMARWPTFSLNASSTRGVSTYPTTRSCRICVPVLHDTLLRPLTLARSAVALSWAMMSTCCGAGGTRSCSLPHHRVAVCQTPRVSSLRRCYSTYSRSVRVSRR